MKSYYLRRGREWICVPKGVSQTSPSIQGLECCSDPDRAWLTTSLDEAHERQTLLRYINGWSTEISAIETCAATA